MKQLLMRGARIRRLRGSPTTYALILMGGSALLFSGIPIAVDVLGTKDAPMTVGAGMVVGYTAFTHFGRYSYRDFRPVTYGQILQRCLDNQVSLPAISIYICFTPWVPSAMYSSRVYIIYRYGSKLINVRILANCMDLGLCICRQIQARPR